MTNAGRASGVGKNAAVNAAGSLVNGLLSALVIVVAAREGQTGEIAAYAVMVAVLALVSGAIAGGSSLLYMSSDDVGRAQVRSHRLLVVTPVILVAGFVATAFYVSRDYSGVALVTMAFVALLNNLAELHYGDLQRDLRFSAAVLAGLSSKALATILVLFSLQLSLALLVAAVLQVALLEALVGRKSWLRQAVRALIDPTEGNLSLRPGLMVFSYAAVYNSRVGVLCISLLVPRDAVGEYGVVLAVYQSVGGVLYSGLLAMFATRIRHKRGPHPDQSPLVERIEAPILAISMLISFGLIVVNRPLVQDILQLRTNEAALWLTLLSLALPAFVANRIVMLYAIAEDQRQKATRIALYLAGTLTLVLGVGVLSLGVTGAALSTLIAEVGVATALLTRSIFTRQRRGHQETPRGKSGEPPG